MWISEELKVAFGNMMKILLDFYEYSTIDKNAAEIHQQHQLFHPPFDCALITILKYIHVAPDFPDFLKPI